MHWRTCAAYIRVGQFFRIWNYSVWWLQNVKQKLNWPFFFFFLRKSLIIFPPPYIVKKNKLHFCKCLKTVLSKTTFYQNFECISLKVLDTGSLQIFASPCKFACQLYQQKNVFPFFFGKINLSQTVYFSISNFW